MLKARQGFTLIELLIVVVIIGILAAIAIPKFGQTREKAYYSAMKSDLKNLQSAQEVYYSANSYNYAGDVADLTDFAASQGVTVTIENEGQTGWAAFATHAALDTSTQFCSVHVGTAAVASSAAAGDTVAGVIACDGE